MNTISTKSNVYTILVVLAIIFILFTIPFITLSINGSDSENAERTERICSNVCGEFIVTRCDVKYDIITCDPNIRVQHFPK